MARGATAAVGERSVSVAGDVVGSLIVTGDNNNVKLVVGAQQGVLLEQLARSQRPVKRRRAGRVRLVPPPFGDSLDRDGEVRTILDAIRSRTPSNVLGPRGIGKTYALVRALNADELTLAESAVYLYAPGPLDDVLQLMFEAWYECDPPFKPSNPQLRRDLAQIDGLVALDSVDLEREAAQQVLLAAAGCCVVVASRERVLTEGTSIVLHGLEPEYAVVLVERELGRGLEEGERENAARICDALQGHPLKIREAVAFARDAGRSLADLRRELSAEEPVAAVSEAKLRAAGEDGRRLLAALALFGDSTVGNDHLQAIANVDHFEEAVMAALRRRDVQAHSPRYNLGATLTIPMPDAELAPAGGRALAHFTSWADENRTRPPKLVSEAPALVALLRWAVSSGRFREAIRLGRAVDHAFALERRFGAWGQVLDLVHAAALAAQDRESQAWSLHQLGTRALCLGEVAAGSAMLGEAIELRRELADTDGAQLSARNLAVATRSRWLWRWIVGHSLLLGLVLAVIIGGAVAAAALSGGGHPSESLSPAANGVSNPGIPGNANANHPSTSQSVPPAKQPRTITFTSGSPPSGTVDQPYTFNYKATGDTGITFSVTQGTLPRGFSLTAGGMLSGKTKESGSFTYTITATGASGAHADKTDTLTISRRSPPPTTTSPPPTTTSPPPTTTSPPPTTTSPPTKTSPPSTTPPPLR